MVGVQRARTSASAGADGRCECRIAGCMAFVDNPRDANALENTELDAGRRAHQRNDLDMACRNDGPARKTFACIAE